MFEGLAASGGRRQALLIGSGLAFGLAALVRPVGLYFLILWLPWLAICDSDRRRGLLMAAALALGCCLAVAPWTVRNAFVHGELAIVEATLGVNLWRGNANPAVANWDLGFDRTGRGMPAFRGVSPSAGRCRSSSETVATLFEPEGKQLRLLEAELQADGLSL